MERQPESDPHCFPSVKWKKKGRQKHSLGQGEKHVRQKDSQFWTRSSAKCFLSQQMVHSHRAGPLIFYLGIPRAVDTLHTLSICFCWRGGKLQLPAITPKVFFLYIKKQTIQCHFISQLQQCFEGHVFMKHILQDRETEAQGSTCQGPTKLESSKARIQRWVCLSLETSS